MKFDKDHVNVMKKFKTFLKQDLSNNVEASAQVLKTRKFKYYPKRNTCEWKFHVST